MPDPRYKYVGVDIETYQKLEALADAGYRTVPAEVRFLVEQEERKQAQELAAVEALEG